MQNGWWLLLDHSVSGTETQGRNGELTCTVTNAAEHQGATLGVGEALVQTGIHLCSCFILPSTGHWKHCSDHRASLPQTPESLQTEMARYGFRA